MNQVIERSLLDYTEKQMYRYGSHVNENRAVPDYRDGLKPVARRVIWALNGLQKNDWIKAARVEGETLGKYHPHGDAPIHEAITTMMHVPVSPVKGMGNWGTVIDPPAAPRYIEMQLSKYGMTFIHSDYIPVMDLAPNYDNKLQEPILLPALMPNLLFNGAEGIAFGITTRIPGFTPKSVLGLMLRLLKKEKLSIQDYVDNLEFHFNYGGRIVRSKENRKEVGRYFKNGRGAVEVECELRLDKKDKTTVIVDNFVPGVPVEKAIARIREIDGVKYAENITDKQGVRFEVKLRNMHEENYEICIKKIRSELTTRRNFVTVVTERRKEGDSDVFVRLFETTIPTLFEKWLEWRVELEAKSLDYRIQKEKEAIKMTKLLLFAYDKLETVFQALRQKKTSPDEYFSSKTNVSLEDAKLIFDRPTRQLSALDNDKLETRLLEQKKKLGELEEWRKKPAKSVGKLFQTIIEKWEVAAN